MKNNTYQIIDLDDEVLNAAIAKFKRYTVEAPTPMMAVKQIFPDKRVKVNRDGMGSIVVFGKINLEGKEYESSHTFDLLPRLEEHLC